MATNTRMHQHIADGAVGPSFIPGQDDSTPAASPPIAKSSKKLKHSEEELVWQHLLDAQKEHIATLHQANTTSECSGNTHTAYYENKFQWETLCATTMQEIMGVEKARLDIEGNNARHMLQYVDFDNLINSPGTGDTNVLPRTDHLANKT